MPFAAAIVLALAPASGVAASSKVVRPDVAQVSFVLHDLEANGVSLWPAKGVAPRAIERNLTSAGIYGEDVSVYIARVPGVTVTAHYAVLVFAGRKYQGVAEPCLVSRPQVMRTPLQAEVVYLDSMPANPTLQQMRDDWKQQTWWNSVSGLKSMTFGPPVCSSGSANPFVYAPSGQYPG